MPEDDRDKMVEALRQLLEQLREARKQYQDGQDSGRLGAAGALNAVVEFLNEFEETHEEHLAAPVLAVSLALSDLDKGILSPLVAVKRPQGRKPSSTVREEIRSYAALTCDLLMKAGFRLDKAAGLVAARLHQLELVQHGSGGVAKTITYTTIKSWRNAAWQSETYNEMREMLEISPGANKSRASKTLLDQLEAVVLEFRASDEKT